MQSLGGNYHRKLWEEYHLLFLPSGLERKGFSLEALEEKGIQEGDTVRMYGNEFDYYK